MGQGDDFGQAEVIWLRRALKLSQEEFAIKLGASWVSVNRWENGKVKPSPAKIQDMESLAERNNLQIRPALMRRGKNVKFQAKKK